MRPKVAFIGTGGTIASVGKDDSTCRTTAPTAWSCTPTRSSPAGRRPHWSPSVLPVRYRNIPSTAIDFADWKALVLLCERLVADTADLAGIVIGHGTATLEETAYILNLTLKVSVPVVLVGSQRPSSGLSTDAGLNLVNAIRVAASPEARGMGVLVVLNDEIQAARDVTKTATLRSADVSLCRLRRAGPCRRRCDRVLPSAAAALLSGHGVRHPLARGTAPRRYRLRLCRGRRHGGARVHRGRRRGNRVGGLRAWLRTAGRLRGAEGGGRQGRRGGAVHPRRQRAGRSVAPGSPMRAS